MAVQTTKEQAKALMKSAASYKGPIQMINLLKFRARTPDGKMMGEQSYQEYSKRVTPMVYARGGRVVWRGKPLPSCPVLIGDKGSNEWDLVLIVEYPSLETFMDMSFKNPEYDSIHHYREAALERTVLIPNIPLPVPSPKSKI